MSIISFPRATYRIQFTPQFGFRDALRIIPYLQKLGISHLYASPITRARRGSTHGYDVCDYATINSELGTVDDFTELLNEVAQREMGWLQDIVPNHMAYSHENPYLVDVLEHGSSSRYYDMFDITWNHQYESLRGRVLAPFLGKTYGRCVVDGELRIVFESGGLWIAYYDQRYPLSPDSYGTVLSDEAEGFQTATFADSGIHGKFLDSLHMLVNLPGRDGVHQRYEQCTAHQHLEDLNGNVFTVIEYTDVRPVPWSLPENVVYEEEVKLSHLAGSGVEVSNNCLFKPDVYRVLGMTVSGSKLDTSVCNNKSYSPDAKSLDSLLNILQENWC